MAPGFRNQELERWNGGKMEKGKIARGEFSILQMNGPSREGM